PCTACRVSELQDPRTRYVWHAEPLFVRRARNDCAVDGARRRARRADQRADGGATVMTRRTAARARLYRGTTRDDQGSLFDDALPLRTGTAPRIEVEECAACGVLSEIVARDTCNQPVCAHCLCDCCGKPNDCDCVISTVDGYDPETGPYAETGCEIHRGR